jgi:hypothetical protein
MSAALAEIIAIYQGSDGEATKALYARLEKLGPIGAIAVNLFRAQKASERAKVYRGGGYRGMAYDRKEWAIENLCTALSAHAAGAGLVWGWGIDDKQPVHKRVLYVDLPTGQVSFHCASSSPGPDYPGQWDGMPGQSPDRILRWIGRLLDQATHEPPETGP